MRNAKKKRRENGFTTFCETLYAKNTQFLQSRLHSTIKESNSMSLSNSVLITNAYQNYATINLILFTKGDGLLQDSID